MDTVTDMQGELSTFTTTALTSLKTSINHLLTEQCESHFEHLKTRLQGYVTAVISDTTQQFTACTSSFQNQATAIIQNSKQAIKEFSDTLLNNSTTNAATAPSAPSVSKMHPKFNVDSAYARHLLNRSSNSSIPPHLQSTPTIDTETNKFFFNSSSIPHHYNYTYIL